MRLVTERRPITGCGLTTTLVSLIAQAGPTDQAVATAVSYLFRSLGSVLCLSVGSTIFQATLRSKLRSALEGADVDEVRVFGLCSEPHLTNLADHPSRSGGTQLYG